MTMTIDVKPCPFCGGTDLQVSAYGISCSPCGITMFLDDGVDLSLLPVAWNKRSILGTGAAALIKEMFDSHRDPHSELYDACEISPCDWCERAEKVLGGGDKDNDSDN